MRHQASSHTHLAAVVTTHFIRLFSSDLRGNIREIFKYEKPYKAGPTHFQVPTSLIRLHTLPCVCSPQHDTHTHTSISHTQSGYWLGSSFLFSTPTGISYLTIEGIVRPLCSLDTSGAGSFA
jgi:hypothetical protein